MSQMLLPIAGVRESGPLAGPGDEIIVDNFAGGGGASMGIEMVLGRTVDVAINHDPAAVRMHQMNHPRTRHFCENIFDVDPVRATGGRPVGLAWFSPDCTHHSRAKGGRPRSRRIRGLAWIVLRWGARVRPRVIILENVQEFSAWGPLTRRAKRPKRYRKGETFQRWLDQLRRLGYAVDYRTLNAADYGAPTNRRRLFLVARCDGQAIHWPEPTHGPGREHPHRTAAEIIDWWRPCPSIFERKPPLAEKTMRRIAMGIKRYVLEAAEPFIVQVNHGGQDSRTRSPAGPLSRHGYGLVAPHVSQYFGGMVGKPATAPLPTVTAIDHHALVAAFLSRYNGQKGNESRCTSPAQPLGTQDTSNRYAVVSAHITKLYGTNVGADLRSPLPTITAGGNHLAEVRAFLLKYYGTAIGQDARDPLGTLTCRHRFGLVTIKGESWRIVDIGLRMLDPRELARAQGFPDDYLLIGSKADQVAAIGNSVSPPNAAAVVRANVTHTEERGVA